eukprot:SAG31_NODE_4315_length_3365_cov_1.038579_2_plen_61_part_00
MYRYLLNLLVPCTVLNFSTCNMGHGCTKFSRILPERRQALNFKNILDASASPARHVKTGH